MNKNSNCHVILNGKYELCKGSKDRSTIRIYIDPDKIPSKSCEERSRGIGNKTGKINAPTFAYQTVYGEDPPHFLRGRTNSPKKEWRGLYVDAELKDEWLDQLNALPIDVRSTEEGKSDMRPAFMMFRMPPQLDELHVDMVNNLDKHSDLFVGANVGQGGRPRICVANRITNQDPEWSRWWSELPSKIESAYEDTLKKHGLLFTVDNDELKNKYIHLAREHEMPCDILKKDAPAIGEDTLFELGCHQID